MQRDCTLYLDILLRGKPCFCVQEKKEQNVQCLVLFLLRPPSFWMLSVPVRLIRHSSHGCSESIRCHLIFSFHNCCELSLFLFSDTCFDLQLLFQTQLFWFPGRKITLCWLFFPFLKNNGIRMTNSCLWNAYSCFLCCSVRKKVKF